MLRKMKYQNRLVLGGLSREEIKYLPLKAAEMSACQLDSSYTALRYSKG